MTRMIQVCINERKRLNQKIQRIEALSMYTDIKTILNAEEKVDLERLKSLSMHGIPNELRGRVWKYLLGIEKEDRSNELSIRKERIKSYHDIDKNEPESFRQIKREILRYQSKTIELKDKSYTKKFERIIYGYLNSNPLVEYNSIMINICATFIYTMNKEYDAYVAFEFLMNAIADDDHFHHGMKAFVANFLTLFRSTLPDLFNHFEDEEVNMNEFITSWLQSLLSKELKFQNLIQLLDIYFSISSNPFEFHTFVCLGILQYLKDKLEELEQSEIRSMLLSLPLMNMKPIIGHAYNFQYEVLEKQLFEEEMSSL